jgi:hypothetical protein
LYNGARLDSEEQRLLSDDPQSQQGEAFRLGEEISHEAETGSVDVTLTDETYIQMESH